MKMTRAGLLSTLFLVLSACGGGGGGGGGGSSGPPAPSGLSYSSPQTFVVNQPITALNPTVSGTVSTYAVAPALPAGLSLNSTSGVVSGTPTAAKAAATYVVTASNAGGSTTANLALTVNDIAPNIAYGSNTYTFTTGVPVNDVKPTSSGGTVVTYSVSPTTLPDGLSFSATDGSITGTPTTVTPAAAYTVSAQNSGGTVTKQLTLEVESGVLLELGHASTIALIRYPGSRVFSMDSSSHWVLWNAQTAAILASGEATCSTNCDPPGDAAGTTFVVKMADGFELRSLTDGHLLGTVTATPSWWKLASDGSYLVAGNASGATAWSPSGTVLFSRTGNYSNANVFAAPAETRIANGPAGATVIETVTVAGGGSTNGPAFQGTFRAWFSDGARFITNLNNTTWIYSKDAVQLDIRTLSLTASVGGTGNWFWLFPSSTGPLSVYTVGNSAIPATTYAGSEIIASGSTIAIVSSPFTAIDIVDLSGATLAKTTHAVPFRIRQYGAISPTQWLVGGDNGRLVDASSAVDPPRTFGLGSARSIAGSSSRIVVATSNAGILYFDANTLEQQGHIDLQSSKVMISSDGSVLGVQESNADGEAIAIRIISLPSATEVRNIPYPIAPTSRLLDFTLTDSGLVLGRLLKSTPFALYDRQAEPTAGGPLIVQDGANPGGPLLTDHDAAINMAGRLSPDGTRFAAADRPRDESVATTIYVNGSLATAVPGWPLGWIDNDRLLINSYVKASQCCSKYSSASLVDSAGHVVKPLTLPELTQMQRLTDDTFYSPEQNAIYSVTDDEAIWTSPSSTRQVGAVAGSRVIFASGATVRAESH